MRTSFASLIAVAAATFVISSPAGARPGSIRSLATEELRLTTIAYRMAAGHVQTCPRRDILSGMVLHDLTRYKFSVRPAVSRAFSMTSGFGVLGIVPGSVAAEAGLRVDDEIVAVGDLSIEDPEAERRPRSYRRMEQFHVALRTALSNGRTHLTVRRGATLLRVPFRAQYGCGGTIALTNSSTLNAWSDGKHIIVTTGMVGLSRSDDEIAFVIAHEMAHNVLGHFDENRGRRGIFGLSQTRRGEIEADNYAVRFMVDGGYQPAGGITFLQNARQRLWWNMSLDHPGFGARIKSVIEAIESSGKRPPQGDPVTTRPEGTALTHGIPQDDDFKVSLARERINHALSLGDRTVDQVRRLVTGCVR